MTTKSFILASLTGTIILFLLGYLLYGIVFHQDFDNEIITANPNFLNPPRFQFLFIGNFVGGIFLTYLHLKFKSISNSSFAFVVGFLVFGLMGLYNNLISYGRTDILTFQGIFLDAIILAVMGGAASFFIYYTLKWFQK